MLQEARALLRELRRNGTIAYVRCPAPPAEHLGHLRELAAVLARRRPRTVITQELRVAVADIERLSELEPPRSRGGSPTSAPPETHPSTRF